MNTTRRAKKIRIQKRFIFAEHYFMLHMMSIIFYLILIPAVFFFVVYISKIFILQIIMRLLLNIQAMQLIPFLIRFVSMECVPKR